MKIQYSESLVMLADCYLEGTITMESNLYLPWRTPDLHLSQSLW